MLPRDLGDAYRGSSLVCHSIWNIKVRVGSFPLTHISDIHELAFFQKLRFIFMGKLMLPQCIK